MTLALFKYLLVFGGTLLLMRGDVRYVAGGVAGRLRSALTGKSRKI